MKVIHYSSQKNVFLVSGMFAGAWIWERCYKNINADIFMMEDPLCDISENLETLSNNIIDAIEEVDKPVSLIGNSLGSLLCLMVAAKMKNKIESVIISGSAGFGDFPFNLKLKRTNPKTMLPTFAPLLCNNLDAIDETSIDLVAKSFKENFKPIVKLIKASNLNLADTLIPQVSGKIYAVWGDSDKITPFIGVKSTLDKFDIDTHIINDCGHSPMFEKPLEFASYVNACLE